MPFATIDGISTRYEVLGSGPPLLLFSPGGFNATIEAWSSTGTYAQTRPLDVLSRNYTCIVFDRREAGQSGGRVERITWSHYAAQGRGLLQHLGIERAHLAGGCLGCSLVLAFAIAHPQSVASMVLYWPAGGPKYRLSSQARFAQHLAFLEEEGLAGVVSLARASGKPFGADPRGGPWAALIQRDPAFAERYAAQDLHRYKLRVMGMSRTLFDRDTVPGAEPEDLSVLDIPALVIPGRDASHASSAARYLEECLPLVQYWDVAVPEQTRERVAARLTEFLAEFRAVEGGSN